MSDSYSELMARYAHEMVWAQLHPKTVHEVKRRILDSIGVAIAACQEDAPKAARKYAGDLPHPRGANLWGTAIKVTPESAALANGIMVRYLDFNDTYLSLEPLHPSDTIPGLIALCQWANSSTKNLICSIAIAYEIGVSLCDAASLRSHGWDHVNYIAIATACGAGNLLGLTPDQIENAISISAIPHAAMRQTRSGELSMWKGAAAANSVRNAIFASHMAYRGFTGPFRPFEGEMGFFRQLLDGESFDRDALRSLAARQAPTRICDTYTKKWPVEYHAQSAVDAAQTLSKRLGGIAQIQSVSIDTFKAAYEIIAKDPEKWAPTTRETADHSLPYVVSVTLLDGTLTSDSFSKKRLSDTRIKNLLAKTRLQSDEILSDGYPEGIPNRITITKQDGEKLAEEVRFPRGHHHNPMTDSELEAKFRANVAPYFNQAQTEAVLEIVWQLEDQPDLELLMASIGQ